MWRRSYTTFLIVAAALAHSQPAPTEDEARVLAYVHDYPEKAAADILKLEAIERATPVVSGGQLVVLALRDGTLRAYATEPMLVEIAGYLRYAITVPEATTRMPRTLPWGAVLAGSIGVTAGLITGILLSR